MAKAKGNLTINKQVEYYLKAAEQGSIPDEQNPVTVVQMFSNELLSKIASRQLDMKPFAVHELMSRGLDKEGKWVGFLKAETIWSSLKQMETKGRKHRSGL